MRPYSSAAGRQTGQCNGRVPSGRRIIDTGPFDFALIPAAARRALPDHPNPSAFRHLAVPRDQNGAHHHRDGGRPRRQDVGGGPPFRCPDRISNYQEGAARRRPRRPLFFRTVPPPPPPLFFFCAGLIGTRTNLLQIAVELGGSQTDCFHGTKNKVFPSPRFAALPVLPHRLIAPNGRPTFSRFPKAEAQKLGLAKKPWWATPGRGGRSPQACLPVPPGGGFLAHFFFLVQLFF